MNTTAQIINDTTCRMLGLNHFGPQRAKFEDIRANIFGWSDILHYAFFGAVLDQVFAKKAFPSILICGVYRGLDLALIAELAQQKYPGRPFTLHGVDLFSSEPCADWPEEKRSMSWEEAFGCPPPCEGFARNACPRAGLFKGNSIDFLSENTADYDFIYLDTSHDEFTVRREIESIKNCGYRDGLILAGDDFTAGNAEFDCGVARACDALVPDYIPLFNRIWLTQLFHVTATIVRESP